VVISSGLFEAASCAIFIFSSLVGIFNAPIRLFRACKLGCPGSCGLVVLLVVVVVAAGGAAVACANANWVVVLFDDDDIIDGTIARLTESIGSCLKIS